MKNNRALGIQLFLLIFSLTLTVFVLTLISKEAFANPPYDVTVVNPGTASTGGPIDTYELWRDCDTTPTLVDADVQVPETYAGILTADGSYTFCVRGRNAAGLGDVGLIVDVVVGALQAPGPIDGGSVITVQCPNGPCVTTITPR